MKTPTVQILYPPSTEDEQLIPRTKCSSAIILYLRIKILVSAQKPSPKGKGLVFCERFASLSDKTVNRQTKQKYWSHS